ncbi:MAG: Spy/CpxP family protein refolding chaperone [Burkholderiaceae bacterium]|nr:Spy/CpxP family protein refolding chaperone [Burkholderiaceae bacterium]
MAKAFGQTAAQARTGRGRRGWIAGASAVTLAALGAAWHRSASAHGMGRGFMPGPMGPMGTMDPQAMGQRVEAMVQWMLADVDATPEQRARISAIAKGAFNDLAPLRARHLDARRATVRLLAAPTIDRAAIERIRIEQIQLAETTTRRVTQALLDAAEVLTPEQRAKLAAAWESRRRHRHG